MLYSLDGKASIMISNDNWFILETKFAPIQGWNAPPRDLCLKWRIRITWWSSQQVQPWDNVKNQEIIEKWIDQWEQENGSKINHCRRWSNKNRSNNRIASIFEKLSKMIEKDVNNTNTEKTSEVLGKSSYSLFKCLKRENKEKIRSTTQRF